TKHGAERLKKGLVADGFAATSVHGNKSQGQRDHAIKQFRAGAMQILVATDVAARGIDIPAVGLVVNYDLPNQPENYVHRIGRTARAGRSGVAVTLCAPDEVKLLRAIEKLIKAGIQVDGDMPDDMPGPLQDTQHPKASKPKRRQRRRKTGSHQPGSAPNSNKTRGRRPRPNKQAA
ncbi:MAG: C-terminal helicase domain-containing protein, partial [Pseudomonadota bacterium]